MPALVAALRATRRAVRTRGVVRDGCVVVNQAAAEFQQRTGHPRSNGLSWLLPDCCLEWEPAHWRLFRFDSLFLPKVPQT